MMWKRFTENDQSSRNIDTFNSPHKGDSTVLFNLHDKSMPIFKAKNLKKGELMMSYSSFI